MRPVPNKDIKLSPAPAQEPTPNFRGGTECKGGLFKRFRVESSERALDAEGEPPSTVHRPPRRIMQPSKISTENAAIALTDVSTKVVDQNPEAPKKLFGAAKAIWGFVGLGGTNHASTSYSVAVAISRCGPDRDRGAARAQRRRR